MIEAFIERYNNGWLLQRHGYLTPAPACEKFSRRRPGVEGQEALRLQGRDPEEEVPALTSAKAGCQVCTVLVHPG